MTALVWDGCVNVRDLGGLPTRDGRVTQFNRIVRADNLRRLSERGKEALVHHGVTRVVDLRFPEELALDAVGELPAEVVHVSVLGANRTEEWQAEQNAAMDEASSADDYLLWSYLDFLERYRERFAEAVRAIAGAPDGAVVVHCMGGKDRTGLVTALVLCVAGVEQEVVAADYALTEEALAPSHAEWVAEAPDETERRRRELLKPSPASVMTAVLDAVEERYGGARAYLRGGGVDDDTLDRVRERLLAGA